MFVSAWFECPHVKKNKNKIKSEQQQKELGEGMEIPHLFRTILDPFLQVVGVGAGRKRTLGTLPNPGAI